MTTPRTASKNTVWLRACIAVCKTSCRVAGADERTMPGGEPRVGPRLVLLEEPRLRLGRVLRLQAELSRRIERRSDDFDPANGQVWRLEKMANFGCIKRGVSW